MTIVVQGPDGSSVDFPDGTDQATISGVMTKNFGGPAADSGVTANKVARSAATGVPVVGGLLNQAEAVTNATLAPILNPLFDKKDRLEGSWSERRAKSLAQQNAMDEEFAAQHPVVDTAAKVVGGVAGSLPAMMAAPKAFGLTGTLREMATRGAASQAALSAADATTRGEDPIHAAEVGGVLGAAAPLVGKGVGRLVQAARDLRSPPVPVAQNVERVAGVDVPLTQGQVSADPAVQAREEIIRRGAAGESAEAVAKAADDEAQRAIGQAREVIGSGLDPTGASARTAPQDAGVAIQAELAQQEQARAAAEAVRGSQAQVEGAQLASDLAGGRAPVSPFDAAGNTGAAVAARRDAAVARTRAAYDARDAVPGTFDESVPQGLAEDIRTRLNSGDNPVWVDPTNESTANKALKLIDETIGKNSGMFRNAASLAPADAAPAAAVKGAPAAAAAAAPSAEDVTVAALRAKFGDSVADAYARQHGIVAAGKSAPRSLLEFIAAKGGLAPHPELEAIGLNQGHRTQVPGQSGFFGTVRKNGENIDRMREAAEEAGYLRGEHGGTSTPTQFLDAIDAELRGQKLYPEGHSGAVSKKAVVAQSAADRSASDRITQGIEEDLRAAGHGELGPQMKERAIALMRDEGMAADDAVETAFRQLEHEDAIAAERAASDFPGDRPLLSPAQQAAAKPVDLRTMDEARKRLVTMYGDAKSAAIRSGDKSDMRAMAKILHEFDNSIEDAIKGGKFSGDAELAQRLQSEARAAHAEYRQTFSSRGPGDEVGRAVEKILGRYSDNAATPEDILKLAYGPESRPGTGNSVKVALRLRNILGENSPEWAQWKQGLFHYVDDASLDPIKRATRIDEFLHSSLGRSSALSATERGQMSRYAQSLRTTAPRAAPANDVERSIARISGADGHPPASPGEVVDMLYSRSGKGDKGFSQRLALALKGRLSPEGWTSVRQGMWEKLTNAGEGKTELGPQALAQRISEFLNESGRPLARVLFTDAEQAEMRKLAGVYRRMVPLKGVTNPSGTAPMLAKIAKKASSHVGAMIGLGAHGLPGALAGEALQRGLGAAREARAGKEAVNLFYGQQPKRVARVNRAPILLRNAVPASQQ
jgi:hypothetical protein